MDKKYYFNEALRQLTNREDYFEEDFDITSTKEMTETNKLEELNLSNHLYLQVNVYKEIYTDTCNLYALSTPSIDQWSLWNICCFTFLVTRTVSYNI